MITFKCLKKTSGILWDLVKIISMLSGLINTIVLNICSLGLITPSSVCHLRTEFWLAVSFGDFSPIGWNDTKIFDPKDILVDPARMSLGYSGSHAGSTKKSLKCPRGMKKTRSYSNTHLRPLVKLLTIKTKSENALPSLPPCLPSFPWYHDAWMSDAFHAWTPTRSMSATGHTLLFA